MRSQSTASRVTTETSASPSQASPARAQCLLEGGDARRRELHHGSVGQGVGSGAERAVVAAPVEHDPGEELQSQPARSGHLARTLDVLVEEEGRHPAELSIPDALLVDPERHAGDRRREGLELVLGHAGWLRPGPVALRRRRRAA